jgi:hypothetical protein
MMTKKEQTLEWLISAHLDRSAGRPIRLVRAFILIAALHKLREELSLR